MRKKIFIGIIAIIMIFGISKITYADVIVPGGNGGHKNLPSIKPAVSDWDFRTFKNFYSESYSPKFVVITITIETVFAILGLTLLALNYIKKEEQTNNLKMRLRKWFIGIGLILNLFIINFIKEIREYIDKNTLPKTLYTSGGFVEERNKLFLFFYIIYVVIVAIFGAKCIKKKNTKPFYIIIIAINIFLIIMSIWTLKCYNI